MKNLKLKTKNKVIGMIVILILLVVWEIIGRAGIINVIFTSYPSQVAVALFQVFKDGSIYPHLLISMSEFAVGFIIAVIVATVFGLFLGWYGILERLFNSTVTIFYITPVIVFLPLLVVWFGITFMSKVIVVFSLAFFPVLLNTKSGVKSVDKNLIMVAKSFGAGDFQILRSVVLPSTTPFILSGIRLGIGRALTGVIIAEFYGANAGLGYLLSLYGGTFQIDKYMAVILIIVMVGLILTQAVYFLEKKEHKKWN